MAETSVLVAPEHIDDRALLKKYGKTILFRNYKMPDGRIEDFLCIDGGVVPVIGMPVTDDGDVILIRQFRFATNEFVYEFPGGCPKGDQSPEEALRMELEEEVGYSSTEIRLLSDPIAFEPASVVTKYHPFLALGCKYERDPHLDPNEVLETIVLPLDEFYHKALNGLPIDSKTATIAMLALPHLGYGITKK